MILKAQERAFYQILYKQAFEKDAHFFYTTDSDGIFDFLKEMSCGESLQIKLAFLCKLLLSDAGVQPQLKQELRKKAAGLRQKLMTLQESDPPFLQS